MLNRIGLKQYGLLFAGVFMCLYFSYHLTHGPRSIFYLQDLKQDIQKQEQVKTRLADERAALEKDVVMLRPETVDPDFLEERVRAMLGYMHDGEMMIPE